VLRRPLKPGGTYRFTAVVALESVAEKRNGESFRTRTYVPCVARHPSHEELLRPGEAEHLVPEIIRVSIVLLQGMFFYGSVPQVKQVESDADGVELVWEGTGGAAPGLLVINYGLKPKLVTRDAVSLRW